MALVRIVEVFTQTRYEIPIQARVNGISARMVEEHLYYGIFLQWGNEIWQQSEGDLPLTVALIEKADGTVANESPQRIRFIEDLEATSNLGNKAILKMFIAHKEGSKNASKQV